MEETKVAFFGPQYGVGGAGHVCSDVGKALGRNGYDVDFLVGGGYSGGGYLEEDLPPSCSIIQATNVGPEDEGHNLRYYRALFRSLLSYLRGQDHVALLSNATKYNIISVWASALSSASVDLHLIEHNVLEPRISGVRHILPPLVRTHYPFADSVIGVSEDIASEFISQYGLGEDLCTAIPNPVDIDRVRAMAEDPVEHQWFSGEMPVVVGVGRFVEFKQFSVLLSAFHALRRDVEARLVMIGDGPLRDDLVQQCRRLRIEDRVDFIGFTDNPYKYMQKADLLAHSSRYEGFGLVLVEALACGTPVVATNCPGGPSDILEGGRYGPLADVGNPSQLASAMADMLANPPNSEQLVRRARKYDVENVARRYADMIQKGVRSEHPV